jgi:hypothetical protein
VGGFGPSGPIGTQGPQGPQGPLAVLTLVQEFKPEFASFPNASYPQFKVIDGASFPIEVLAFDQSLEELCFFKFDMIDFGSTATSVTVKFRWCADTATSGNIIWAASLAAVSPNVDSGSLFAKTFATEQTALDSHLGGQPRRFHQVELTLTNIDSVATGDYCVLRIARKAADGNDTMAGDALLIGVDLEYSNV